MSMLFDEIFPLPIYIFHFYWFIIVFVLLIFFVFLVIRLIQNQKDVYNIITSALVKRYVSVSNDEIFNAEQIEKSLEMGNINYSYDLATEFVKNVKQKLQTVDPKKVVDFNRIIKIIPLNIVLISISFILYFVPPNVLKENIYKILFTRKPEILGIFIFPKDIKIPQNSSCEIKIIVDRIYQIYNPYLFIKYKKSDKWLKVSDIIVQDLPIGKVYKYKITNLTNKIFYKVKFRGVDTKVYTIKPVTYPIISGLKIEVIMPGYTKIAPFFIESFNEIKYLYGSKLNFKASTNKNIFEAKMWFEGRYHKLNFDKKNNFYGSVVLKQDTDLWFEIVDDKGDKNDNIIKYRLNIIRDEYPSIEQISPEDSVVVEKNSKIPIMYKVKDDYGISKIDLELTYGGEKIIINLAKYTNIIKEVFDEYVLDISSIKINYGEEISYKIIAYDNDTTFGPKKNETAIKKIEIFSFEKKHNFIKEQLKDFEKKVLDLLSKEIELKEKIDGLISTNKDTKKEKISLYNEKNNFNIDIKNLNIRLKDITAQIMTDPYFSVGTYLELKNLESSLEGMYSEINPQISENIKNEEFVSASNIQQEVIDTLERIVSINDQIVRKQNMLNINILSTDARDFTKDLLSSLNEIKDKFTQEQKNKLENILSQIKDRLAKINSMLKDHQEKLLPQEFINRRDIKNVDISNTQNLLENLTSAIKMADMVSALSFAQRLLKDLEEMTKIFEISSNQILVSKQNDFEDELGNLIKDIDSIISEQEIIYSEVQKMNKEKIKKILEKQESMFDQISELVEKIIKNINEFDTTNIFGGLNFKFQYLSNLYEVDKKIKSIKSELDRKILIKTKELTKDSLAIWQRNNAYISQIDVVTYETLVNKHNMINENLVQLDNLLNKEFNIEYSQYDLDNIEKTVLKQNLLVTKVKNFTKSIKTLGKKSYLVSLENIQNANNAYFNMKESSKNLILKQHMESLNHQKIAIDELNKIREKFSYNKNQFQQMKNGFVRPMAGKQQYKNMSTSIYEYNFERITLPSAKDYSVPKEIREGIIKSLSENYPKQDIEEIQNYYRELLR